MSSLAGGGEWSIQESERLQHGRVKLLSSFSITPAGQAIRKLPPQQQLQKTPKEKAKESLKNMKGAFSRSLTSMSDFVTKSSPFAKVSTYFARTKSSSSSDARSAANMTSSDSRGMEKMIHNAPPATRAAATRGPREMGGNLAGQHMHQKQGVASGSAAAFAFLNRLEPSHPSMPILVKRVGADEDEQHHVPLLDRSVLIDEERNKIPHHSYSNGSTTSTLNQASSSSMMLPDTSATTLQQATSLIHPTPVYPTQQKLPPSFMTSPAAPAPEHHEADARTKLVMALLNGSIKLPKEFTERYTIGEMLGDGAFGFVFTAIRKEDKRDVAVKFIIRNKIPKDGWITMHMDGEEVQLPQEVAMIRSFRHPNVIEYMEHIIHSDYILLITELHGTSWDASNLELDPINNPGLKFKYREKLLDGSQGGKEIRKRTSCDLFECIDAHTRIPSSKAKFLFAQIVLACDYLQKSGVVHRDIKDENIVVNAKYEIKLIDFGSASKIPSHKNDYFTRYNGTPHFASPEIAQGMPYQGPQAEVWTLGVLLYTIIFGENPFQDKADILAYNGKLTYPRFIEIDLQRLLESMLSINVKARITLDKIKQHPWCSFTIATLKKEYDNHKS